MKSPYRFFEIQNVVYANCGQSLHEIKKLKKPQKNFLQKRTLSSLARRIRKAN